MIKLPQKSVWTQYNSGDILGDLFRSTNIDTKTNLGRLRASPRLTMAIKSDDTDITGMGLPVGFCTHDISTTKQYFAACGIGSGLSTGGTGRILRSDDTDFDSDWDNDGTANSPTDVHLDFSDMINWRDSLVVTTFTVVADSHIKRLTGSWDTTYDTTVGYTFNTNGGFKNLCEGFNGNLYITDDDHVSYISAAGSAVQPPTTGTLDFNGQYRAIWIRSSSNRLWIGLMSYDANVGSKGFVAEWDATGTAANQIYDIDAPCALSCTILNDIPYIVDAYGRLKRFNGAGFIEVARLPAANYNIEMPGIYNDSINTRWIHHRGMEVVGGKINILVNNLVSTGVYIHEMPSGIWEYDMATNSLYHKLSPCTASTDFGQQQIKTAGALFGTKRTEGNLIAGFEYYTDAATTNKFGIFYDDVQSNTNKHAIIETTFKQSNDFEDFWNDVKLAFRELPSGDLINVKYRVKKSTNFPALAQVTWTATNKFTSTDADFANVTAGNEIEVVMGKHATTTAHVSSISEAGGTYTITLDESVFSNSGSAQVVITNYKKIGQISAQNIQTEFLGIPEVQSSPEIQIKLEFRVNGDFEFNKLAINNRKKQ